MVMHWSFAKTSRALAMSKRLMTDAIPSSFDQAENPHFVLVLSIIELGLINRVNCVIPSLR